MNQLSQEQLAKGLNELMRRYVDEPERFENEMTTFKKFMADEASGAEPDYGTSVAEYLFQIVAEL